MRNTTNTVNLGILFLFVISPFIGYFSQTFLHKGYLTVIIPPLIVGVLLLLLLRKKLEFTLPLAVLFLFTVYTIISDGIIADKEFNLSYFLSNELIGSVLVYFMIDNTLFKEKYMRVVYRTSVAVLFIAFVVSLIQQFKDISFFVSADILQTLKLQPPWETRLPSIYSWIGPLWILSHCFFPVLSIVIAQELKKESKFVWVFFLMGAIVSFLSKSRFIFLNFAVLLVLIPIYRKLRWKTVVKYLFSTLVVIGLFLVVSKQLNFDVNSIVEKRILEKDRGGITKGAAGTRLLAFDIFGKLFMDNPLFGKGKLHDFSGNSKDQELVRILEGRSSQIHVGYLSLLYYYGVTGGILFLGFIGVTTHAMYQSAKIHHYWGPFFGFIQLILTNTTGVCLHIFIMGYILCFMFDRYYLFKTKSDYAVD